MCLYAMIVNTEGFETQHSVTIQYSYSLYKIKCIVYINVNANQGVCV